MEESLCVQRVDKVILDAVTVHFHCAHCTPRRRGRNAAASADPTLLSTSKIVSITSRGTLIITSAAPKERNKLKIRSSGADKLQ